MNFLLNFARAKNCQSWVFVLLLFRTEKVLIMHGLFSKLRTL